MTGFASTGKYQLPVPGRYISPQAAVDASEISSPHSFLFSGNEIQRSGKYPAGISASVQFSTELWRLHNCRREKRPALDWQGNPASQRHALVFDDIGAVSLPKTSACWAGPAVWRIRFLLSPRRECDRGIASQGYAQEHRTGDGRAER